MIDKDEICDLLAFQEYHSINGHLNPLVLALIGDIYNRQNIELNFTAFRDVYHKVNKILESDEFDKFESELIEKIKEMD